MIAPGFIAALFFSSFVAASVLPRAPLKRACGTDISPEDLARAEDRFAKLKASSKFAASDATRAPTINVYFHVISANETLEGGDIPDSQITDQINVLNNDYASSDVSFTLVETTRTVNATWFESLNPKSAEETAAKDLLRVGGPETLNIFTVGGITADNGDELLGYATFPDSYESAPERDGVVMLYSTVPGGTSEPYNRGRTLTHEVGHWVGLYHTFQGGCDGGDSVDDTPPEASPAYGCPTDRDTCDAEGLDPVTNFMDYTDDSCMDNFTKGQITRFIDQIAVYRNL